MGLPPFRGPEYGRDAQQRETGESESMHDVAFLERPGARFKFSVITMDHSERGGMQGISAFHADFDAMVGTLDCNLTQAMIGRLIHGSIISLQS